MTHDQREIRRKLRILQHAEMIGDVSRTCRYFGIDRASFYRWREAYRKLGEAGLSNSNSSGESGLNDLCRTGKEDELRQEQHHGPVRIHRTMYAKTTVTDRSPISPQRSAKPRYCGHVCLLN